MIRYECDQCGRDLGSDGRSRYVVRIEISGVGSTALTETAYLPPERSSFRYDLCPGCHARYVRNPLTRVEKKFQFSQN